MDIIHIFLDSSFVVQLVMIKLVSLSIFSWSMAIWKSRALLIARQKLNKAKETLQSPNQEGDDYITRLRDGGHFGTSLATLFRSMDRLYDKVQTPNDCAHAKEQSEQLLYDLTDAQMVKLRKGMTHLGLVASTAPYIGLFGTVWGILVSFQGLADAQIVTLQTVAPGIIEALVATAMGLFAAIPAIAKYTLFTRELNSLENEYLNLQSACLTKIDATKTKQIIR